MGKAAFCRGASTALTACLLPHPIPYQGSKRRLAERIGVFVPAQIDTWFEPFAGSAAMTLWVARHRAVRRIVLGESLAAMAGLWHAIIQSPEATGAQYRDIWCEQSRRGGDYFDDVRARFNASGDPVDLLYLLCRCVKNAVRFNREGAFTQSVDRRRLGVRPDRMAAAISGASALLRGRTEIRAADWLETLGEAAPADFAYLDPPYLGVSEGRDRRYAQPMPRARLIGGLAGLHERKLRFLLSYDGRTGEQQFGETLPDGLGLARVELRAGRSTQATLHGRVVETVESLYIHGCP
jgi:DNA adenine methylase